MFYYIPLPLTADRTETDSRAQCIVWVSGTYITCDVLA